MIASGIIIVNGDANIVLKVITVVDCVAVEYDMIIAIGVIFFIFSFEIFDIYLLNLLSMGIDLKNI